MAVQAPSTTPTIIDRAEQAMLCGVSFLVGGAFAFFGGAISEDEPRLIDLVDLSWSNPCSLRERLRNAKLAYERLDVLEAAFLDLAPISQHWDEVVRHAVALLRIGLDVQVVAKQCDTSQQTLITRFRERTGMTPKTFSRIERFQQLLRNKSHDQTWAEAALDAGFSDQSHMVREFRNFAGVTPTSYQLSGNIKHNHIILPT